MCVCFHMIHVSVITLNQCRKPHVKESERRQISKARERERDRDLDRVGNGCFNQISIGLKLFGFCFCLLNKTTCLSLPCDLHISRGSIHVIEAYVILVFWGDSLTPERRHIENIVCPSHMHENGFCIHMLALSDQMAGLLLGMFQPVNVSVCLLSVNAVPSFFSSPNV